MEIMMSEDKKVTNEGKTEARRDFLKKAAYVAPVVMTMNAMPSLAQAGSNGPTATPTCGADEVYNPTTNTCDKVFIP